MTNCSNNGECKLDNGYKFKCNCFGDYIGRYCEVNMKPCSNILCLNNGTCHNSLYNGTYYFSCECNSLYFGQYCQNKIDICKNITCSKNGYCYENSGKAICECFKHYLGDDCSKMTNQLKFIKKFIEYTSIIAICNVVVFFMIIILMDLTKSTTIKKRFQSVTVSKKFPMRRKLIYVNKT